MCQQCISPREHVLVVRALWKQCWGLGFHFQFTWGAYDSGSCAHVVPHTFRKYCNVLHLFAVVSAAYNTMQNNAIIAAIGIAWTYLFVITHYIMFDYKPYPSRFSPLLSVYVFPRYLRSVGGSTWRWMNSRACKLGTGRTRETMIQSGTWGPGGGGATNLEEKCGQIKTPL